MRSALTFASLGLGASASAIMPHRATPRNVFEFTLYAHTHSLVHGHIGQLDDGQNRIGGKLPSAWFTYLHGADGGLIWDQKGRGCILTPPNTTQFQCDEGAKPTPGFEIACDGRLLYNGSPEFYACPVDDSGAWNLYQKPAFGQKKCIDIALTAHGSGPVPYCRTPLPPAQPAPASPAFVSSSCSQKNALNGKCGPSTSLPLPPYKTAPPLPACKQPYTHIKGTCKPAQPPPPPSAKPWPPPPLPLVLPKPSANSTWNVNGTLSPDGSCGGSTGYHCLGFGAGSCCSSYGWCGATPAHCDYDQKCQPRFGNCSVPKSVKPKSTSSPAPSPSKLPTCGPGKPKDKCTTPPPPSPSCGQNQQNKCGPTLQPPKQPCGSNKQGDNCNPAPSKGCPHDLKGDFEFPHLIIPVDESRPDKVYPNQLNGTISDHKCTVFNFDIHQRFANKTCSLAWLFPEQKDLQTSAFTYEGEWDKAKLSFWLLDKSAEDHHTTWKNVGSKRLLSGGNAYPGFSYNAHTMECPAGKRKSIMVCGQSVKLNYFQDFNPSPIGLYVRVC